MQRVWTPPLRLVFGAATALGLFSALQAYRLGEPRLQVSGLDRPALRLPLIADGVGERGDRRVCHQHPVQVGQIPRLTLSRGYREKLQERTGRTL